MTRSLTPSGLPIYDEQEFIAQAKAKALPEQLAVIKGFTSEVKAVKDTKRFRFTISTAGIDRDKDVINVAGWNLDNYRKNPVVLFGHKYGDLPVGKSVEMKQTKKGLDSEVEFASGEIYPFAETVRRMVAEGFLSAASVGFKPLKYMYNEERRGVDIEESELLEWSIVPVPANPECLVRLSAALAPGALKEFADHCEQFMEACKGKGQWVVEADLKQANDRMQDMLGQYESFKSEVLTLVKTLGEAKQSAEAELAALKAEKIEPAPVEDKTDLTDVDITDLIFEDEDSYIFGLDLKRVTEDVRGETRRSIEDAAREHIKRQLDYARGRICD